MRWRQGRRSTNVEDRRGRRIGGVRGVGLSGGALLIFGIIYLLLGGDPTTLLQMGVEGGGASVPNPPMRQGGGQNDELADFVSVVLADTEDIWTRELARVGVQYQVPELVVYRDQYPTGCGVGSARAGPFYCPADQTIYIDLSFYNDLERQFEAPGDFAQAYVIAHEVGHHIQKLLGLTDKVSAMRGRPDYNQYSVRLELQADFLAGVWAHHNSRYLERGDIEEAMRAANQIGDDAIQSRTQGKVLPHAFTHGTSEQRMRWFNRGWQSGRIEDGDTFAVSYENL